MREFLAKVAGRYAIIVCAQAEAHCPKMCPFAGETLYRALGDPEALDGSAELQLARFRRARDEIDARIHSWPGALSWPVRSAQRLRTIGEASRTADAAVVLSRHTAVIKSTARTER